MCHVLLISDKKETAEVKKEFEKRKIMEIKKKHISPTVQFFYGRTKSAVKNITGYKKRHPKATIFDERLN